MKIGKIKIGLNNKPCIIAEISGNHNQKLQNALRLVKMAADAGADMVKLQTYTPETITLPFLQLSITLIIFSNDYSAVILKINV